MYLKGKQPFSFKEQKRLGHNGVDGMRVGPVFSADRDLWTEKQT